MIKKCSKCAREFDCKADATGCWCEKYTLAPEALSQLRECFADCLCPECLVTYQEKEQAKSEL